ncbi:MAG: uroporphyrinogen-III synthase [Deltaproteobacteria bacterium]|nr:uroporphyrinogen-III synthase [Deltaproteobacteria bacterium]
MYTKVADYTVVVTRPEEQSRDLLALLKARGFDTVACPTVKVEGLNLTPAHEGLLEALQQGRVDWLVFSSANGVRELLEAQKKFGHKPEIKVGVQVAVQGRATAAVFEKLYGRAPELVPQRQVSEGLLEELLQRGVNGRRIVAVKGADGRSVLSDGLKSGGAEVEELILYRTVPVQFELKKLEDLISKRGSKTVFLFFSPSALKSVAAYNHLLERAKIAVIGPVTASAARELGYEVFVEAQDQSDQGIVAALENA